MTLLGLQFLAPVAGLVAAIITVPLLALLYFLKLRRRPVRVSSTLLWEQAVQDLQVNTPFRMLRLSWLLLLQLTLLCCLILAIARPAIDLPSLPAGKVIILIDASASMSARDGEVADESTRLDEAREQARDLISRLVSTRTQAMVVSFAHSARTLQSFTADKGALRQAVGRIEQTDQPARLETALKLVSAFVSEQSEESTVDPPRVFLLSDGWLERSAELLTGGIGEASFEFLRCGPEPGDEAENIGIVALSAKRDYEDPALLRLFVRVQGRIDEPINTTLVCSRDGETVQSVPFELQPPTSPTSGGTAGWSHTLELLDPTGGLYRLSITREDALDADNRAWLAIEPPRSLRIALVRPAAPRTDAEFLLERVLSTLDVSELATFDEQSFAAATRAGDLAAFDLVVLDRIRPTALPPVPTISFAAPLPIPGLAMAESADGRNESTRFLFWQRTHPVMRYVGLNPVIVRRSLQLVLPGDDATLDGAPAATALATGLDGPLIGLIRRAGLHRLVIAFDLNDTNWTTDPSFPIFMSNAVDFLVRSGQPTSAEALRTTAPITLPVAPDASVIGVRGPVEFSREVLDGGSALPAEVTIGPLPRVGVYELSGVREDLSRIGVNLLSPFESELRTVDAVQIAGRQAEAQSIAASAPREVWHWFILIALALLAIEWMLFAWRMRV